MSSSKWDTSEASREAFYASLAEGIRVVVAHHDAIKNQTFRVVRVGGSKAASRKLVTVTSEQTGQMFRIRSGYLWPALDDGQS